MKDRRKSARLQTRLLNKQNEVLHKELEVSKFEFSEIINQYNQGKFKIPYTLLNPKILAHVKILRFWTKKKVKQDRFITKNQLYDDIIQSETAHLRLKAIPEELEMLEFNINGKIDVMKCEIEWSKENIEPLEPALKHMQENVGDLHEELRRAFK